MSGRTPREAGIAFLATLKAVFGCLTEEGVVSRYGEGLTTNGIVLSADEKRLFVTNGPALVAFEVQVDGALTSQREFVKLEGCAGFQGPCTGDGSTFDAGGRLYVTSQAGVQVIGPDGKYLGLIPTPRAIISVAFSGTDRKTLYVVGMGSQEVHAYTLEAAGILGPGRVVGNPCEPEDLLEDVLCQRHVPDHRDQEATQIGLVRPVDLQKPLFVVVHISTVPQGAAV